MPNRRVTFDLDDQVWECESTNAGVSWPIPIHRHLDRLVELVEGQPANERTTRKELVAALIHAAPRDPKRLAKVLHEYRAATVRDLEPKIDVGSKVVVELQKPGPRQRRT